LNSALAQRYAAALADVALERKNADGVRRDLEAFTELYFSSADLRNTLESPAVDADVKQKVIEKITSKMGLDAAARNFVMVVVRNRRAEMLQEIQKAFREELNRRLGIEEAEVTSARELSQAEKKELTEALARRTGKKIEARFHEDKALLGGAVVRLGSTIYDGSVREQLNRLREQLEAE
jgi:F-type H+-transporting ATPase subunit delta